MSRCFLTLGCQVLQNNHQAKREEKSQEMCVLCMFYVDWELGGQRAEKNFRVGIFFLNKKFLG